MGTRPPSRGAVDCMRAQVDALAALRLALAGSMPGRGDRPKARAGMLRADSGLADANATALSLRQNLKDCKTALNGLDDEVQRLAVEWEREQDATYYEQQSQKNRARATELLAKAEHQGLAAQSCMQQAETAAPSSRSGSTRRRTTSTSTAPGRPGRKWVHLPRGAAGRRLARGAAPRDPRPVALHDAGAAAARVPAHRRRRRAFDGTLLHKGWLGGDETRWRWTEAAQRRGRRRDAARRAAFCCDAAGDALAREPEGRRRLRQPPPSPDSGARARARRRSARAAPRRGRRRLRARRRARARATGGGASPRRRRARARSRRQRLERRHWPQIAVAVRAHDEPFIDDDDDADGVSELIDVTVRNARNKPLGLNVRDGYVSHVAAARPRRTSSTSATRS